MKAFLHLLLDFARKKCLGKHALTINVRLEIRFWSDSMIHIQIFTPATT